MLTSFVTRDNGEMAQHLRALATLSGHLVSSQFTTVWNSSFRGSTLTKIYIEENTNVH